MFSKYILFCVVTLSLQYQLISSLDSCETRRTCQECITDPTVCVWCAMNDFNGTRCKPQSSYRKNWCPTSLQNPMNFVNASKVQEFSSDSDHVIQIKPQRYKLKLRPGKSEKFNFSFQGAQNFPVDLYFLLDASKTMDGIKNMTAKHSEKIFLAIKKMTSNVHLGLGTFVDKRVLPFTNTFDGTQTYSFRHRLKLADDFKKFKEVVSQTPSGANRDVQEGGLDALAQVMVCKDIIGWRNESRKIIVFLTDGPYHAAGDGKSAGLFQPYDGKCYTQNNSYAKELEMDYPSVGMINKLATDRDIIIIFLVDYTVEYIYHGLSSVVSGSRLTSYERNNTMKSDAIVGILEDIYEKISKKIKLKVNVKSGRKKNFQISFNPDCTTDDSASDCDVEIGKEHQLVGTVKLLENDGSNNAVIDIVVEGIGEKLTLDIDIIKTCECDKQVEANSTFCYGEKRSCGICRCSDKRYGENCACAKSATNLFNDNSTCIAEGSTDVCSGHGSCICGICQCRDRYEGKFCECNVDSCPRGALSGAVCNGHGKCDCGVCKCSPDWSGDACDCYNSENDCKGDDGTICHNRGQCSCGTCNCEPFAEWDARNHQDMNCKVIVCPDCHEQQCRKLENCARCRRSGRDDCMSCEDRIKTVVLESLPQEYLNSTELCSNIKVEVGCYTSFVYRYNDPDYTIELIVAHEKDCARNYYLFGGLFLLTLLLVGAGTLIAWKLLTEARDRQEYLRFMQQNKQDNSGPNTNPLYTPPSTTFNNPAFRKRSVNNY